MLIEQAHTEEKKNTAPAIHTRSCLPKTDTPDRAL